MNEFNSLRAKAAAKRDKIIAQVRADYVATLAAIAKLEADFLGKSASASRYRRCTEAVGSVVPQDRPFTVQDVIVALEELEPARNWRKGAVVHAIGRLIDKGVLKRVRRAARCEGAVYARSDLPMKIETRPIRQVIQDVLTRPMTVLEITVAIEEAGYQSTMTPKALRDYVGRKLRAGGFRRDGERWTR